MYGQFQAAGVVVDEKNEPLAFVNILINEDYQNGVVTDINGKFKINSDQAIQTLTLSYVGYEKFCLLYTSPSPRDATLSRMPSSA